MASCELRCDELLARLRAHKYYDAKEDAPALENLLKKQLARCEAEAAEYALVAKRKALDDAEDMPPAKRAAKRETEAAEDAAVLERLKQAMQGDDATFRAYLFDDPWNDGTSEEEPHMLLHRDDPFLRRWLATPNERRTDTEREETRRLCNSMATFAVVCDEGVEAHKLFGKSLDSDYDWKSFRLSRHPPATGIIAGRIHIQDCLFSGLDGISIGGDRWGPAPDHFRAYGLFYAVREDPSTMPTEFEAAINDWHEFWSC